MSHHRIIRITGLYTGFATIVLSASLAGADIYEWEYIDPSDPSQGRQESSVLLTTKDAVPNANLRDTNLRKAYFAGVDLSGAGFGEYLVDFGWVIPAANLTDADFAGADLTGATLYRSPITGAFFTDALIAGASLSGTSLTYQQFASTASYQNGDLAGIGLSYNNMAGWDLSNLDMARGFLNSSTLTGANLSNSTLTSVWLQYAELTGANLSGADLSKATLQHADVSNADFAGANLTRATLRQMDGRNADFTGANLSNVRFDDAVLTGADLTDATINGVWFYRVAFTSPAQLTSTASYKNGDFSRVAIRGDVSSREQDLSGIDLSGFNLTDVAFRAVFDGADLSGADLTGAALDGSSFIGADFTDANITDTYFDTLSLPQLMSTANYKTQDLSGILVIDYDLSGLDLSGFNLSDFSAISSDFSNANFSGADLTDAGLGGILNGANFTDAIIIGAGFGTTYNGFTYQQLASTASFKAGDLGDIGLRGSDLTGWDLSDLNMVGASLGNSTQSLGETNLTGTNLSRSNLTGANFIRSNLTNTDFTDAIIKGAKFKDAINLTEAQVRSTTSYKTGDLSGILWWNLDLSGWDLSGVNLSDGNFQATEMVGIDLSGSDLTGSYLAGADLTNANLRDANLTNVQGGNLTGADLTGAVIRGLDAGGLTGPQILSTASFQTGDLAGFDFPSDIDYSGWSLSGFNMAYAGFGSADMTQADLSGANLLYAYFGKADLTGADLSGANLIFAYLATTDLTNADLSSADTRRTNGLTDTRISTVADTTNMIWPDGSMRNGLVLSAGDVFRYQDLVPIESQWSVSAAISEMITIHDQFSLDEASTLQVVFTDPDWQSMIEFDSSVGTAQLDGTLELGVDLLDGLNMQNLLGSTFQLFDWSGVAIVGGFDAIVLDPAWYAAGLSFDLSQLMITGEVHVVSMMGDLNGDAFVGIEDLNIVLARWNQAVTPGNLLEGDLNGDGFVGIEDLNGLLSTWNGAFPPSVTESEAAIPEPAAGLLIGAGGVCLLLRKHLRLS